MAEDPDSPPLHPDAKLAPWSERFRQRIAKFRQRRQIADDGWGWLDDPAEPGTAIPSPAGERCPCCVAAGRWRVERSRRRMSWLTMTRRMVGQAVVLDAVPPHLLPGLPEDCQAAITAIVGKPIKVSGYRWGLVELEFRDQAGDMHFIWVEPAYVRFA